MYKIYHYSNKTAHSSNGTIIVYQNIIVENLRKIELRAEEAHTRVRAHQISEGFSELFSQILKPQFCCFKSQITVFCLLILFIQS